MLSDLIGNVNEFLDKIEDGCLKQGLEIRDKEIDHICYRCPTIEEYKHVIKQIVTEMKFGFVESECMIGGRPITTITLYEPIKYKTYSVTCIEIPCPKVGRVHASGLEHAEVVIGKDDDTPVDTKEKLLEFAKLHPDVTFDFKAANKHVNADLSLNLPGNISVKFHLVPLYKVCKYEHEHKLVELVPAGYFD